MALLGAFGLAASVARLDELDEKLRLKFRVTPEDASAIRAKLETVAEIVTPTQMLAVIRDDPDDNRVLE